jgi:hypothetical protein
MQENLQFPDGTNIHITDGRLHREDGPALETSDGTSYYFIDGALHRDNGPAICSADPKHCHWYKHGIRIPSQERSRSLIAELRHKHLGIHPVGTSGSDGRNGKGGENGGGPVTNSPTKPKT